jgi:hypothetical protein
MIKRRPWLLLFGLALAVTVSGCTSDGGDATGALVAVAEVTDPDSASTTLGAVEQTTETTTEVVVESEVSPAAAIEDALVANASAEDAYPVRVLIPEIGVEAEIIDLGLNEDGTLEVPKDSEQTGWYTGRSVPGDVGPSVVVGHIDSTTGPAVFYRLQDLEVGHTIEIQRSDGVTAMFRVSRTELVLKDEFPTEQVYGSTAEPTLRLITCGGSFDRSVLSYRGNLIVYAEHIRNITPVMKVVSG